LWVMGQGIDAILWVAATVSGWEGSVLRVPAGPGSVLPLLTFGAVFAILWQGGARWLGAPPVALAFLLWALAERPVVTVSESGRLVGVLGEGGRALNRARGEGFAARSWLENDGDAADQEAAAARAPPVTPWRAVTAAGAVVLSGGTGCGGAEIAVLPEGSARGCLVVTEAMLERLGAIAIHADGEGWRIEGARSTGRPWSAQ
ncbi:MAG: competence protein, partial [Pseudomonadota bacterium]